MRRVLLIIAGLLIAAGFSFYILDLSFEDEDIVYEDDSQALVEAGDVAYLAETPEPTVSMAATVQKADETPQPTQTPVIVDGWELVWVDEFDAPSVDLEVWTEVDRRDNYNRELQYYTPVNSYIEDGCLYLTARDEEKDGKDYTSAMVETRDKLSFCYGRIEARIKLPVGKGLFPAFWLLSDNFEIDVMEMIGSEPEIIYGVNHYRRGSTMRKTYGTMISETPEEFHVYALEWNEDELLWYIDGELFYQTDEGVPDEEMYIIFTMAVGGTWPGRPNSATEFPCSMAVDYIKLYRHI